MLLKANEILKILFSRESVRYKEIALNLSEKTGKKYTSGSLSQKINRGTISYNEVMLISDILGYDIAFNKRSDN